MSSEASNVEDPQQTQYNELVLVLNKIKVYVEMVAKRLSETCEDVMDDSPRMLEGITLRDYQLKGCKWILRLYENGMNGVLADEMGLGKTVQVITALASLIEAGVAGPFLVVAPLSLLSVWADQMATFAPRLPSLVYYGALNDRLKLRRFVRRRVRISMENCESTPDYAVDKRSHTDTAVMIADSFSASDSVAPKMRQRIPCVDRSPASSCSLLTCKFSVDSLQSPRNHLLENKKAVTVKSVVALRPLQEIPSSTSSSIFDTSESSAENPESCLQELPDSVLGINLQNSFTVNDMRLQRVDEYENEATGNTPASLNKSDLGCAARPSLALTHLDEVISEVLKNTDGRYQPKLDSFANLNNSNTHQDLTPTEISLSSLHNTSLDTEAANSRTHSKADVRSKDDVLWTCPIVLTSYEVALRDATYLGRIPFKCLVVDEGQRLKNPASKLYKRLAKFNAGLRLLLTGSPLQNRISELWSLLHFVLPEVFTSLEMFESWFDPVVLSERVGQDRLAAAETQHALVTKLHCIISPFMLRRTKSETNLVLPPKRELLLRVGMTEIQKAPTIFQTTIMPCNSPVHKKPDLYEQARSLCLKNIQCESLSNPSPRNSIRTVKCGGSITWLDPANIIPDPNESATGKKSSPRPTTRLRCFLSSMSTGTENPSVVIGQRMTRSKTSRDSQPSISTASSECDKDVQVLDEKRQKYTISHLVNLNNGLMVLRQIANHPYLVMDLPDSENDSALDSAHLLSTCREDLIFASEKTKLLDRLLTVLINTKHKVLIFSQLVMVLDVLEELLNHRGWLFVRLDGSTKLTDRQVAIRRFNHESVEQLPVFLVSARAGGCGLNLQTAADTVIIFDSDWNPQTDLQAQDRCHRIGQNQPVLVIRLVTAGTVDETIVQRAQTKRGLERLVLARRSFAMNSDNLLALSAQKCETIPLNSGPRRQGWLRESSCIRSLCGDHGQTLSKKALLQLLSKTDFHKTVSEVDQLSDDELHRLLDRTDMYEVWKKQKLEAVHAPEADGSILSEVRFMVDPSRFETQENDRKRLSTEPSLNFDSKLPRNSSWQSVMPVILDCEP